MVQLRGVMNRAVAWCQSVARQALGFMSPSSSSGSLAGYPTARFSPRDDRKWLETFRDNSIVRGPVDRIAKDAAMVKWTLYRLTPNSADPNGEPMRKKVVEHELLDLWKQPNPLMLGSEFRWLFSVWRLMVGRFPIFIERKSTMRPAALWPIAPWDVLRTPTVERPTWEFRLRGKTLRSVPAWNVLWVKALDASDPYGWGVGAAKAIDHTVAISEAMDTFDLNMFRNGSTLGPIIGVPGLKDRAAMQADYDANHTGVENVGRTFFVALQGKDGSNPGAVTVANTQPARKELDFVEGDKRCYDKARQNFCMPPEIMGNVENSNRATILGALNIHQRNNILPEVMFQAEVFNTYIVPMYGEPDLVLLPANPVDEDEELRHTKMTDGLRWGALARDEYRVHLGQDPLGPPMGDRLIVPAATLSFPAKPGSSPSPSNGSGSGNGGGSNGNGNGKGRSIDIPSWMDRVAVIFDGGGQQ